MGKKINDYTGMRFGRLSVLRMLDERKSGNVIWECKCDCGNVVQILGTNLKSQSSCGCYHSEEVSKRKISQLEGQRFGRLTVVRASDMRKNRSVMWECLCDCGNTTYVRTNHLLKGAITSCGCLHREIVSKSKTVDLAGQRFGRLTVVRALDTRKYGCIIWECICDCGNTVNVISSNLMHGVTRSCGCLRNAQVSERLSADLVVNASTSCGYIQKSHAGIDLTSLQFGRLTAIRATTERDRGYVVWECLCECGNTVNVASNRLKMSIVTSCGCDKGSNECT